MKTELVKPTKKGKRDGEVDFLCSDNEQFLVMRGDYSRDDIIKQAVEQRIIDAEDVDNWVEAEYDQCWYKTTPSSGDYSAWNYPRHTPCRGAYFASILVWG